MRPIALAALLFAAACATGPTYMAQEGGRGSGYADYKLESNKFRVTYDGDSSTPLTTVENFLLYRSAALTLEEGFDHFVVLDEGAEAMSTFRTLSTSFGGSRFGYGARGGRFGFRRGLGGGGFGGNATTRERREYVVQAVILTGRGPKPDSPDAFDAREVVENLGPVVLHPAAGG